MSIEPYHPSYHDRDIESLEPFYTANVIAMTKENLSEKSDIAAELAWRDARIVQLETAMQTLIDSVKKSCERLLKAYK